MRYVLPQIHHTQAGFQALVNLAAHADLLALDELEIDMSATTWFDADMCAAFGAILYRLGWFLNDVTLSNLPPKVEEILSKNGFMNHYGRKSIPDSWRTTIPYRIFDTTESQAFAAYIHQELLLRAEIPSMTSALHKEFGTSISEIFSNAVVHSQTKLGIFSCGQYYPKNHRLCFSIADLGVGIHSKVQEFLQTPISPESAIAWATRGNNTTKRGPIPGGLGLKLLQTFIGKNGGSIQIVSDGGYWYYSSTKASIARLTNRFPGTVVTIEINTADSKNYMLASERLPADSF